MSDWLKEIMDASRQDDPIPCGGCGKPWKVADTVEATIPARRVEMTGIKEPFDFIVSEVTRVGPCCSELADPPEEGGL